jgi:hypothetical protein
MRSFANDAATFVTGFVVNRLAVVVAAFFVLRAVLDVADGSSPLASIVAAMFLLSVPATAALLRGWNNLTPNATADVLASLWTYVVSKIMPMAAGLAVVGSDLELLAEPAWMRLVGCAAGFLPAASVATDHTDGGVAGYVLRERS